MLKGYSTHAHPDTDRLSSDASSSLRNFAGLSLYAGERVAQPLIQNRILVQGITTKNNWINPLFLQISGGCAASKVVHSY